MPSSRHLAAIMFTDIVGYTALMGSDEQKAIIILEKNRQIQKPIIEQYNGRWIKELGDGVMASFDTVSEAVNAAIKIQQTCNASKDFQLRIGIHTGEVIFENNDVFGDGVNIASRVQAIAHPGSIFISESAHNSISNKKEFQTRFFTEVRLKNVRELVKVHQVIADGIVTAPLQIAQKIKPKPKALFLIVLFIALLIAGYFLRDVFRTGKNEVENIDSVSNSKSIAVLPFLNMSADSTQEYFSDGMTESLISDLAQIPGLFVVARNSVFEYKGKAVNPVEVGKQLRVRYILEGSLQRSGNTLRINAQLTEAQTGFHVWADKFNRPLKDIFSVQDDISKHIVKSLKMAIAGKTDTISKPPTSNLDAYDYFLRAQYIGKKNRASSLKMLDSAMSLYEKAIALDPEFALAYAMVAKNYNAIFFVYDNDPKWESKAFVATEKALSLDPKLADAYVAKANLTWTLSNGFPHEKSIKELKHAIQLNPNLVEAHEALGAIYFHIGLLDEALHELRIALKIDPASQFARPRLARVHWYQQKFDSALAEFSAIADIGAGFLREKAIVQWCLGKTSDAFKTMDQLQQQQTGIEGSDIAATYAVLYAGTGKKKEAQEKINFSIAHGSKVSHFHHAGHLIASAYALMGKADSAVVWLQKTADYGMPCYPLFRNDPNLRSLKNDRLYISLMEKMRKQWEIYKSTL